MSSPAQYITDIKQIINSARSKAYTAVNSAMLEAYWLIGKRIVETETAANNWSVRTLDRNISTLYYQRLLSSQKKDLVIGEMKEKTAVFQQDKSNSVSLEFIKNPAVLEFLGLPSNSGYVEAELEKAIIDHIQQFLLELGKGFAFVARQQLIRTETAEFYIDLVFYNFILKCFVRLSN